MSARAFVLLCISVWINYIDRGNLSVAAPALAPELQLTPSQMGVLLSGFFWTYSLLQPVAGWLIDRYDTYRLYAAAFAIWSIAVAAGGLATGFYSLLATRLLLGAGESLAYPAYSRLLAAGFTEDRRGFANSMIDAGTKAGPALGTFLGAMVIAQWGWRPFFFVMGIASLLWLIPWNASIPAKTTLAAKKVKTVNIFVYRDSYVTFAGLFCFNYAYYFLLTWLPTYLVKERHFSLRAMAIYGALPFAATAIASVATATYADKRGRQTGAPGEVRRKLAVAGLILAAAALSGSTMLENNPAMICLVVAFIGIGMFTANCWAISQTLAGPRAAGTWTGWQNAVGNMGGVIAPIVTGWSVSYTGSFLAAFYGASAIMLIACVLYGIALGPIRQLVPEEAQRASI